MGARIQQLRKQRGLSPAQLAARCAGIGAGEITEHTIRNIESGRPDSDDRRRRDVTVDELFALAIALEVPPAALLFDPRLAEVPLTREVKTAPAMALAWVAGETRWPGVSPKQWDADAAPIVESSRFFTFLSDAEDAFKKLRAGDDDDRHGREFDRAARGLSLVVKVMGMDGMHIPPIPAPLIEEARRRGVWEESE